MEVSSRTVISEVNEIILSPGALFVPQHGTVPEIVRIDSAKMMRAHGDNAIVFTTIFYRLWSKTMRLAKMR